MISFITGVPGSGKSFYAVHLINKFISSKDRSFLILHNIDGLQNNCMDRRLIYVDWSVECLRYENINDRIIKLRKEHGLDKESTINIFIDEAWQFFGDAKDSQLMHFLTYHRHMGVDIYLITQDESQINKKVVCLSEYTIRALPNTFNPIPGRFLYKREYNGMVLEKITVKKCQKTFALYKSFDHGKKKPYSFVVFAKLAFLFIPALLLGAKAVHSAYTKQPQESVPAVKAASASNTVQAPVRGPVNSTPGCPITITDYNASGLISWRDESGTSLSAPLASFVRQYRGLNLSYMAGERVLYVWQAGRMIYPVEGGFYRPPTDAQSPSSTLQIQGP